MGKTALNHILTNVIREYKFFFFMSIFDFSCYNVLGIDSDVVALLDVNIIQQHLSTVTFPEALLCFPYASHDSKRIDAWLFFHACLCGFISDGFGVQTHYICQLLSTFSFS